MYGHRGPGVGLSDHTHGGSGRLCLRLVESARCTAGGVYLETGTETFVGSYNGMPGTFRTTYLYTAKFQD